MCGNWWYKFDPRTNKPEQLSLLILPWMIHWQVTSFFNWSNLILQIHFQVTYDQFTNLFKPLTLMLLMTCFSKRNHVFCTRYVLHVLRHGACFPRFSITFSSRSDPFSFLVVFVETEVASSTAGIGTGAIAGIVIGVILIVLIAIDFFCCFFNSCGLIFCCKQALCGGAGGAASKEDCK